MLKIMDKIYITIKEASRRYGLSVGWFNKRIENKQDPPSLQMEGKGKHYFDVEKTDEWFKNNMKDRNKHKDEEI